MCTMYEKRERFVKTLRHRIECGQVAAWSFGHEVHEVWTQLYVQAIQQMRVHVDLPSNNPMPTLRPFETMACGTACVTWAKLPAPLVEGVHYRRYETAAQL